MIEQFINQLLTDPASWKPANGGFTVFGNAGKQFMADADLNVVHPNLSSGMRLLFQKNNEVLSKHVISMLRLWETRLQFQTTSQDNIAIGYLRNAIVSDNTVLINGTGFCYVTAHCVKSNEPVMLPLHPCAASYVISSEWLDATRPGWLERFNVAMDLGLPLYEAVESMLTAAPKTQNMTLPTDIMV